MNRTQQVRVLPKDGHDDRPESAAADSCSLRSSISPVRRAIARTRHWLLCEQHDDGSLVRRTRRRHDPRKRDDPAAGLSGPRRIGTGRSARPSISSTSSCPTAAGPCIPAAAWRSAAA